MDSFQEHVLMEVNVENLSIKISPGITQWMDLCQHDQVEADLRSNHSDKICLFCCPPEKGTHRLQELAWAAFDMSCALVK